MSAGDIFLSKKYKNIYLPLAERIYDEEYGKHKTEKERIKSVKNKLHVLYGAYTDEPAYQKAGDLLSLVWGKPFAEEILRLHTSTRERLGYISEFYGYIFEHLIKTDVILDLGCGFNPFALPWMPKDNIDCYYAADIDTRLAGLINGYFKINGLPEKAFCADLAAETPDFRADAVFAFKLLPVLETQKKGRGYSLINELDTQNIVVTFPLKTLCGKDRGFGRNYAGTFEKGMDENVNKFQISHKKEIGNELVYILERHV